MSKSTVTYVPSAVAAAIVVALGAAVRYPGGTLLDPTSHGYSLTNNFLSDLGMTVAYNGRPNMLGAALFVLSLLGLVTALGLSLAGIIRQYLGVRPARGWALGAALLVPLACAAFAAVAVTPENRVMALHVDVTVLAWRLSAGAALLATIASLHVDTHMRPRTTAWAALTAALSAYVLYLAFGPAVDTAGGLRAQVLAQKVITTIAVTILTYLSLHHRRVPGLRRWTAGA